MRERKFCQTSFSRWSKLWSNHLERNARSTVAIPKTPEVLTKFSVCSIRYPDPAIKVNDTVKIDLATGKISDFIKFDTGVIAMVTGGRNMGRVGVITHRERHDGGFNIVHIKDAIDNSFATRENNVFVIGSEKPWISLPKGKGVKLTIAEERDRRRAHAIAGH
jgi:small subunit ribosomal protein S4e